MMEKLTTELKVTVAQKRIVLKAKREAKRYLHPVLRVHWPSQFLLKSWTNQ